MKRPIRVPAAVLALGALVAPAAAHAQGTVGSQGLGYPPGQYTTLSMSTGGAVAEFDPASPSNPAAVANLGGTALFMHFAPERRRLADVGDGQAARVQRFPVIGAIVPFGSRGAVGLTSSTLLDRSWATTATSELDDEGRGIVEHYSSRGAINDVRLAAGWSFGDRIQAGVAGHALVGSNRLTLSRVDQTGEDVSFEQVTDVTYSGLAASAGVHWNPTRAFAFGLSGAVGGTLRARVADTSAAEGSAPARATVSARYAGIPGAMIAARANWQGWSSLDDLGGPALDARDGWEYSLGADVEGPRLFGTTLALRAGARMRDLPFAIEGDQPSERALSGGIGMLLGGGRVLLDLGLERAQREAAGVTENAWTFGAGVTVRP